MLQDGQRTFKPILLYPLPVEWQEVGEVVAKDQVLDLGDRWRDLGDYVRDLGLDVEALGRVGLGGAGGLETHGWHLFPHRALLLEDRVLVEVDLPLQVAQLRVHHLDVLVQCGSRVRGIGTDRISDFARWIWRCSAAPRSWTPWTSSGWSTLSPSCQCTRTACSSPWLDRFWSEITRTSWHRRSRNLRNHYQKYFIGCCWSDPEVPGNGWRRPCPWAGAWFFIMLLWRNWTNLWWVFCGPKATLEG